MDGVLNTSTNTVHRHQESGDGSACGATRFVAGEQLRRVDVEHAITSDSAKKCGRCFSDGGSY
jgi:hypothetical protein